MIDDVLAVLAKRPLERLCAEEPSLGVDHHSVFVSAGNFSLGVEGRTQLIDSVRCREQYAYLFAAGNAFELVVADASPSPVVRKRLVDDFGELGRVNVEPFFHGYGVTQWCRSSAGPCPCGEHELSCP
ncbi:MAG: hypothetical protein L0H93_12910 [Nocardioides sp.]|nr:hypothetical protein [Nocardioides sp.]